jgi:hypothetical protein
VLVDESHEEKGGPSPRESVSRPCGAINPCEHDRLLFASQVQRGAALKPLKCTATSTISNCSNACAPEARRMLPRPNSHDSGGCATPTSATISTPRTHIHALSGGNSGHLSSACMLQPATNSAALQRNIPVPATVPNARACIRKEDPPVTSYSNARSGDQNPSAVHMRCYSGSCGVGGAPIRAAVSTGGETFDTTHTDVKFWMDRISGTRGDEVGEVTRVTSHDMARSCRHNSITHSRHSSHDVIDLYAEQPAGQSAWWSKRKRCVLLGEDVAMVLTAEKGMDAIMSVHETDRLMYNEAVLPCWELTPVRSCACLLPKFVACMPVTLCPFSVALNVCLIHVIPPQSPSSCLALFSCGCGIRLQALNPPKI